MELPAIHMKDVYLESAMPAYASHHQLLDQVEKTLSAATIASASPANSVIEMDSVQSSALELSNQSALVTVTVVSENSAVIINASQNHSSAAESVATYALLTETATAVSSVLLMESARHLALELSNLNALMTLNVAVQVSAMLTLSVSHTPLLDQVERTLFADLTEIASHTNSVTTMDSAQTLEWDLSILYLNGSLKHLGSTLLVILLMELSALQT